ncbi:MAG TPA: hypothetical protein DCR05_08575 [Alphaproteobacteria bacterium]|nr:hypothetical protein [Alphaproteobacteria bacterium]
MLGRHADSLFWMARYLERSENLARQIQAAFYHSLTRKGDDLDEWASIIRRTGMADSFDAKHDTMSMANALNFLLRDKTNDDSVISLLAKSRQNARSVRNALTQEVWQSLNESWMTGSEALKRPVNIRDLPALLENIIKASSVFRGALYGTMLHNDIFNFLRLGTFIERADNTARIVGSKYHRLLPTAAASLGGSDQSQWEVMLRALAAWRSYNWLNKGHLDPSGVASFLIFDERMPRSLSFCYKEICANLQDLETAYGRRYESGDRARDILRHLEEGRQTDIHRLGLRDFINVFIADNNNLSLAMADDFNLEP